MSATENPELAEAIVRQWTWKTPAMQAMAVAICRLALDRATQRVRTAEGGPGEFSANDLPAFAHGGGGIAGAIFHRLAKDGVLCPVTIWTGSEHSQKYVRNAGGNRIGLWRLASAALARALLKAHGQPVPELKQPDLLAC